MSDNSFELLERLEQEFSARARDIAGSDRLEEIRVRFLGKKSEISAVMKGLKDMEPELRKEIGARASAFRASVEQFVKDKEVELTNRAIEAEIAEAGGFDVTLPSPFDRKGSLHPITIVARELTDIFTSMGFNVVDGPELESE